MTLSLKNQPNWSEIEKIETTLLKNLSIEESVQQFMDLYEEFGHELEATEHLFRAERMAYIIEFQRRLQRLAEWQRSQGGQIVSKSFSTTN